MSKCTEPSSARSACQNPPAPLLRLLQSYSTDGNSPQPLQSTPENTTGLGQACSLTALESRHAGAFASTGKEIILHKTHDGAFTELRMDSCAGVREMAGFFFFQQLFQNIHTGCASKFNVWRASTWLTQRTQCQSIATVKTSNTGMFSLHDIETHSLFFLVARKQQVGGTGKRRDFPGHHQSERQRIPILNPSPWQNNCGYFPPMLKSALVYIINPESYWFHSEFANWLCVIRSPRRCLNFQYWQTFSNNWDYSD